MELFFVVLTMNTNLCLIAAAIALVEYTSGGSQIISSIVRGNDNTWQRWKNKTLSPAFKWSDRMDVSKTIAFENSFVNNLPKFFLHMFLESFAFLFAFYLIRSFVRNLQFQKGNMELLVIELFFSSRWNRSIRT